jgi:ketosteroid isomerase-like protein
MDVGTRGPGALAIALLIIAGISIATPRPSGHSGETMTTRATVQAYFDKLKQRADWHSLFADDLIFTQYISPLKRIEGKSAFLDATKRFYTSLVSVEVSRMVVDGAQACVTTHYQLQRPGGLVFDSDVAEFFQVHEGKIRAFAIYFDPAPFPK